MPIEQRVISGGKIGAKNAPQGPGLKAAEEPPAKGGGKRVKLLVIGAVLRRLCRRRARCWRWSR